MELEPILQMGIDGMTPIYAYHKFLDRCEWQNRFQLDIKWGLVWYKYMGLILKMALMLGCTDGSLERGTASVSGSKPQYSRLEY